MRHFGLFPLSVCFADRCWLWNNFPSIFPSTCCCQGSIASLRRWFIVAVVLGMERAHIASLLTRG